MTYAQSTARAAERTDVPQKSPQAFRTISEVSEDLDVPAHVLRFWESRFTQIRPLKRGGGRRYYRPADVALLKGIRRLLYDEGMTIKGAQKVMRERGVRFVSDLGTGEQPASARPQAELFESEEGKAGDRSGSVRVADSKDDVHPSATRKPLLTSDKRASLEAALSLLYDLRAELSETAGREAAGERVHKAVA